VVLRRVERTLHACDFQLVEVFPVATHEEMECAAEQELEAPPDGDVTEREPDVAEPPLGRLGFLDVECSHYLAEHPPQFFHYSPDSEVLAGEFVDDAIELR